MTKKTQQPRNSPEVRERAAPMVMDHEREHASQRACIVSIAAKIGRSAQTLHDWVARLRAFAQAKQGRRCKP